MDNNENKILDILNNYQPTGPDEKLKNAIFAASSQSDKSRQLVFKWLSAAAVLGILLSVSFYIYLISKPIKEIATPPVVAVNSNNIENTIEISQESKILSLADIEYRIEKAGMAARALALADIFAAQPGNVDYAITQYKSIIETYPDFEQAEIAKNKLNTLQKGI